MFTGLIQAIGKIRPLDGDRFAIAEIGAGQAAILTDLAIGDSVAVDGVCLTVEEILSDGFVATASPETLQRTTLGQRTRSEGWVNLETSLRMGSKLGGHFVTGHVDGVGCLLDAIAADRSWEMTFGSPPSLVEAWQRQIAPYLVPKGSIAVNGISLTVAECDPQGLWFRTAVIPHSYAETNLKQLGLGDWVNLEGDILGKYVNRLLAHRSNAAIAPPEISPDFLGEHGYL